MDRLVRLATLCIALVALTHSAPMEPDFTQRVARSRRSDASIVPACEENSDYDFAERISIRARPRAPALTIALPKSAKVKRRLHKFTRSEAADIAQKAAAAARAKRKAEALSKENVELKGSAKVRKVTGRVNKAIQITFTPGSNSSTTARHARISRPWVQVSKQQTSMAWLQGQNAKLQEVLDTVKERGDLAGFYDFNKSDMAQHRFTLADTRSGSEKRMPLRKCWEVYRARNRFAYYFSDGDVHYIEVVLPPCICIGTVNHNTICDAQYGQAYAEMLNKFVSQMRTAAKRSMSGREGDSGSNYLKYRHIQADGSSCQQENCILARKATGGMESQLLGGKCTTLLKPNFSRQMIFHIASQLASSTPITMVSKEW